MTAFIKCYKIGDYSAIAINGPKIKKPGTRVVSVLKSDLHFLKIFFIIAFYILQIKLFNLYLNTSFILIIIIKRCLTNKKSIIFTIKLYKLTTKVCTSCKNLYFI